MYTAINASADLREVWKRLAAPWKLPFEVRMARFTEDCNPRRGGACHYDAESAIRNNIIPSIVGDTHLEQSTSAMQGCKL